MLKSHGNKNNKERDREKVRNPTKRFTKGDRGEKKRD